MGEISFGSFGSLLKSYRKRRYLTQRQLAALLDVHHNTIGIWERGDFLPATRGMVLEIARQLDLDEHESRELLEASLMISSPYWFMPYQRNPFFTDQETLLQYLHQTLSQQRAAALSQSYALSGLGGVGKTQIAIEYAYRYFQEYTAVFWFAAETRDRLIASFLGVANQLHLSARGEREHDRIIASVLDWLNKYRDWLLIFDNVEDLELLQSFLPPARSGALLFTTRRSDFALLAPCIEVEPLSQEDGALLVLRRSGFSSPYSSQGQTTNLEVDARRIASVMGGLPLALDQAGAYIEETHCSFADFLHLFETSPVQLLQERSTSQQHPLSVKATFALAFEDLQRKHPAAAQFLMLCCFLAPDEIPEALLSTAPGCMSPELQQALSSPLHFNTLLKDLLAYALVRRNAHKKIVTIHRLVQMVLKERISASEQQTWLARAICLLDQHFLLDQHRLDVEQWPWCEQLLPHVLLAIKHAEDCHLVSSELGSLLTKAAAYRMQRARYAEAETLYLSAQLMVKQIPASGQIRLAAVLTGLGEVQMQQGHYQEAEISYQQALALLEPYGETNELELFFPLQGLAFFYLEMSRSQEAEILYKRALCICEQTLPPDHALLATALNNLASFYSRLGRYHEALPLYQRVVQIQERVLEQSHPERATPLNDLALLYLQQGKYQEAEPLLLEALRISEQHLGAKHPDVAAILNNLASLYRRMGRYQEAEPLYIRSLQLREEVFGSDHPYVAYVQNNLAALYHAQGRDEQAIALVLRALQIYERTHDQEHPVIATTLITLADIYEAQGDFEQAKALYQQTLAIREQGLEPLHLDTAVSLHRLADLMCKQGNYQEAEQLYLRALRIREEVLGPEHPDVGLLREKLANVISLANLFN